MDFDPDRAAERFEEVLRSRTFLIAAGIFVAAFAVRWMFHQHGFWIDEGRALMTAKNFLLGHGFGPGNPPLETSEFMALHPFMFYTLVAVSYLFFGIKAVAGVFTVNVLGALTAVMVYLAGKELFNHYAGVAGAVLLVFSPLHFFYSSRVITDAPVTFFVSLALYFWARTETRDEEWSFYATFAAAGLALLTKLSAAALLPALFFYYLYKEREQLFLKRKYWFAGILAVSIFALWEVRNFIRYGAPRIVELAASTYFRTGASGSGSGGSRFVTGLVSHTFELPNILGVPGVLLFVAGFAYAYIYEDRRVLLPGLAAVVIFIFLSPKVITRYVLPFVPAGMIMAGYAVDRTRELAAAKNERGGRAVFALILVISAAVMFQSSISMVGASANGFTGLDNAGEWIRQNSAEDARVIAGSGNTIRFFSDRWTVHAGKLEDQSEFLQVLQEEDVDYVVVDRWERTQPEWYLRIVQGSDAFQPVQAFGPQDNPSVVVYSVNSELLSG